MAVFGIDLLVVLDKLLACGISIFLGIICYRFVKRLIIRTIERSKAKSTFKRKKLQTLQSMFINFTKYIIYVVIILYILSVFGVNVSGIVAGLGVSAALIGLAFQDTAKDIIAGISMIADDEFEIGDTVCVDNFTGEVVFIGLRSTRIRDFKGATMIIANHTINKVINYNLHDSLAIVDVSVAYDSDLEKVEKVLQDLAEELPNKMKDLTGEVSVLGIDNLEESAIVYRMTALVKPMQQYAAQRFLRKEIVDALNKAKIKIPFKQIEVHNAK